MVLIGAIGIIRGILLFITQIIGGIIAAYLVQVLFTGALNVSTKPATTTSDAQAVIIEMLLTAELCFTIFMLAAEKHAGNFIAPVGIGLALFIAELVGMTLKYTSAIDFFLIPRCRCFLDRWIAKPSALLWTCSCDCQIRENSVDLLGRTHCRLHLGCFALQTHQVVGVRDCQSRSRGSRTYGLYGSLIEHTNF